jgi:hypothetical protein
VVTLVFYLLSRWGEKKYPGLGSFIAMGYFVFWIIAGYFYISPTLPAYQRGSFLLLCFVISFVLLALGGIGGLIRHRHYSRASHRKVPYTPSHHNYQDNASYGADKENNEEYWRIKNMEERWKEEAIEKEEAAQRANEDDWEEKESREEQKNADDAYYAQKELENENLRRTQEENFWEDWNRKHPQDDDE